MHTFMFSTHIRVFIHLSAVANRGQKRVSGPLDLKLWVVVSCECWEPNSGPLPQQYAVLTSQRLSNLSSPTPNFSPCAPCGVWSCNLGLQACKASGYFVTKHLPSLGVQLLDTAI